MLGPPAHEVDARFAESGRAMPISTGTVTTPRLRRLAVAMEPRLDVLNASTWTAEHVTAAARVESRRAPAGAGFRLTTLAWTAALQARATPACAPAHSAHMPTAIRVFFIFFAG